MATIEMQRTNDKPQVAGVQELIDRIRGEGVAKGRNEGEALVASSREEAVRILDDARQEAQHIHSAARSEAERLRKNTKDALRLAARDAVLALSESLRTDFIAKVRRLVSHTMQDRAFLERLILEVARRTMPEDAGKSVEVLLPNDVVTYEELKKNPQDLAENSLSRFVLELSAEVLREGLVFIPAEENRPGLRLHLKDDDVEIDLTDEAVADLLMDHLGPRFRALLDQPKA
jgi:V/A-type H+/Na+-transporting ATPase subunit E